MAAKKKKKAKKKAKAKRVGKGAPGRGRRTKKSADKNATSRPVDWDAAVSACYLRSIGQSQLDAATAAGVSERSLRAWEHSEWWTEAQTEAHTRWLGGIVERTKAAINDALDPTAARTDYAGNIVYDDSGAPMRAPNDPRVRSDMARHVADRMIEEMAPPKQRITHTSGVDPVDLSKLSDEELQQYHNLMTKAADE